MADKKISQLTSATTPLSGTEVLPIVQGGTTVKVTVDNLTTGKGVTALNFGLAGNQSSAAWTTSGIRYKNVTATLTDTTSSGTVAAAYTNVFGGNTIAATNVTTFTDYISTWISDPVAGSNVTITNKWSLGTEGAMKIGGVANAAGYQLASGGLITESTTTRTLSAGDNGKIIYCTSGSATTINCAAGLGAGFSVTIIQGGAGKVTVAANGQTLVSYSSLFSTMGQYAVISLVCPVANTFVAAGNLGV